MVIGFRPDAEFLPVVAKDGDPVAFFGRDGPQIINGCVDGLKWNGVSQHFAPGENADSSALLFRQIVSEKILILDPGIPKMGIIDDHVANPGVRDDFCHMLLPNALGQPHSHRGSTKLFADEL